MSFYIAPRNKHDSVFFIKLFDGVKQKFHIPHGATYPADFDFDATHIYKEIHKTDVNAVISTNEGVHRMSEVTRIQSMTSDG